ncbi:Eukaryotic translation initiation factor 3 subunit K [Fulvia fulva]|uniref:Eukaryotic translation initiation factor 3 subunit K n=1 Tax=Passalora fulva TaxID=5499 RepID=A0A9Q8PKB0_PASFU|nr:Eukaryotic translation initiation factor 3 subunit K [Fulvia fulva]KAK4611555.1 Eukaryotic translation initiation factor 3 subunit K [Fulvia fulva]UJO23987.1 Eukaryotic translation initiation factor 3 subunit K [Fulvia fulva]WPV20957.1 Eukaryotic translation initiation factor 3 subunit K [Fulvia fulva]WPV36298.1 Eukaryotic translation initiation factor 3 subunit K [Fulvia fulva]
MGVAFDYSPDRPENIDTILNGLDRYNPETTTIFQEYVAGQCESQTYDCYANLALLKLYQFNPHLTRDETAINILVKSLTVFPSPDFSLALALLPPYVLQTTTDKSGPPSSGSLAEAVQHLSLLHNALNNAQYSQFWEILSDDDVYADLTADVVGLEDTMRVRIAVVVSQCMQEVGKEVLAGWLNLQGEKFENFIRDVCGWSIEGDRVKVPLNKENEARSVVQRETVKFDQFSRMVKRAYEQPA